MENDLVTLNEEQQVLIAKNKERIERIFGVQLQLSKNESGSCVCHLIPANHHAQENSVKAKNYIHALTADGERFIIATETYDPDIVNMIIMHKDNIERQSATVILASPYSNNVNIQGRLEDILNTKNIIEHLVQESGKNKTVYGENDADPNPEKSLNIPNFSAINHSGVFNDYGNLNHVFYDDNGQDDIDTDAEPDWCSDDYIRQKYDHLDIHTAVAQLKLSNPVSDSADSSDDEEQKILEIKKDPEYHGKVEFALKLGYHESDLLEALKKLGATAGQNELLSELINQGATRGDYADQNKDESLVMSPDDTDHIPDFTFERKRVDSNEANNLRHIIIDGSNVAMSHGNKEVFSCHGIQLAVDWFRQRGHNEITVFVPQWRKETSRSDARIKDQAILNQLEKEKVLVFTPARRIGGKRVVCYDDRYILKLAVETDGIVVSNDNYRDLIGEKEEFKKVIEERLLMYSFVNDRFMPPDDPLGRNGPTLDNFLQKEPSQSEPLPPPCPYGSKKCTYGNKCKYYHPERRNQPHKSVTEKLAEQAKQRMQEMRERGTDGKQRLSRKTSLQRTQSFNPGDLGRQDSMPFSQSSLSGSASNLYEHDDDKYAIYNERMAENLRKMQQEHSKEKPSKPVKDNRPETPEKKEVQSKSKFSEQTGHLSSPRWAGSGVENLRQQGRSSPRGASPRGLSPVSNLIVPGQGSSFDNGEHFLSGHLLLAKKLSDEANESDKMKKRGNEMSERDGPHGGDPKFQFNNARGDFNIARGQSPELSQQKVKHPIVKQKLSRQLSLQGHEDPRLRQGHVPLQAQYSYDPRRVVFGHPFLSQDLEEGNTLLQDFMQSQSSEQLPELTSQSVYGQNIQGFNQSLGNEMSHGHSTLSRMQSAPDPFILQQQQNRPTLFMRQNSSSDTQLNRHETLDQCGGQFANSAASGSDHIMSRGTLPMKDTTGSVKFQIGGQQPQRQLSPSHYRSMGALNQNFQQFSPHEMEYHYQQQQQLQQQQNQHLQQHHHHQQQQQQQQQSSGLFGSLQQPGIPYMDQQMVQQNMPPTFSRQVSTGFLPSPSIQGQERRQYFDQSNMWADKSPSVSNIPSGFGNINMVQGMTSPPGTCRNRSVTPPNMSPNCGNTPLHNRRLPSPIPADAPIMDSDPRYKVYFHLCGLFPEEKVRAVMNQHPEADTPADICAYIIGAK